MLHTLLHYKLPRLFGAVFLCLLVNTVVAQAELEFENKTQKFSKTKRGEPINFTYSFTNKGNEPLIISDIKVACTCTTFEYPNKPIAPGELDSVTVNFATKTVYGYQDRVLEIYSNDPKSPHKIRFKGMVTEE